MSAVKTVLVELLKDKKDLTETEVQALMEVCAYETWCKKGKALLQYKTGVVVEHNIVGDELDEIVLWEGEKRYDFKLGKVVGEVARRFIRKDKLYYEER